MNRFMQGKLCLAHNSCADKVKYVNNSVRMFKDEIPFINLDIEHDHEPRVERLVVEQEYERDEPRLITTVYLTRPGNCNMFLDITDRLNGFDPFLLIYMSDISVLDVSGCSSIEKLDFMDCVAACKNLRVLIMQGCKQFTEMHFMQMMPHVPNLRSLCLEECQEISYPVAQWIVSSLPNLVNFDFEPKNRVIELKDWRFFYNTFFRVQFGISFKRILPNYGGYVRLPEDVEN